MLTLEMSKNIAIFFRSIRKLNQLQQTEMAIILGVGQGTISKVESGEMCPDLGLWFKFVRAFHITDPYCFTYGGMELKEEVFSGIKIKGSGLFSVKDFFMGTSVMNVKKVRPLIDYFFDHHGRSFENYLRERKIAYELFYILNHPLSAELVELIFSFAKKHKLTEKTIASKINFDSVYGGDIERFKQTKSLDFFLDKICSDEEALFHYKKSASKDAYIVSLPKKNHGVISSLANRESVISYNLLLPYYFLKSTKQCKSSTLNVVELKKNSEWKISYAS